MSKKGKSAADLFKAVSKQEIIVNQKLNNKSNKSPCEFAQSSLEHHYEDATQAFLVISLLESKKSEIVEIVAKTPFDNFEDNIALKVIDRRIAELSEQVSVNQFIIRKTFDEAIEPVNKNVDELREQISEEMKALNKKINMLLPKAKKERQVELLRDPIDNNLLPIFLTNAGSYCQRKKDLVRAQLRITYTILYHCGLRINEIRHLNQKDLQTVIETSQFNLVHHKTKDAHLHILSKKAVQDLQNLKFEFLIVFEKYQYQYLFGKNKPMHDLTKVEFFYRLIQLLNYIQCLEGSSKSVSLGDRTYKTVKFPVNSFLGNNTIPII